MNGFTILQACLGCMYQGELIVNHLRTGRNLAYLMTKVDASRKTSFRKMVDGVSPKFNMESKIAISKCRDHLANCPKPNLKRGSMFTWGVYTSTCHSWLGKATDSGDAGTPSSKSSRFTVAPGIPKNLPGMEKEFQIGVYQVIQFFIISPIELGVHYQLYLTITI